MVNLAQLSEQLESPQLKDRLLALVALREVAPVDAFPLLKKALGGREFANPFDGGVWAGGEADA